MFLYGLANDLHGWVVMRPPSRQLDCPSVRGRTLWSVYHTCILSFLIFILID